MDADKFQDDVADFLDEYLPKIPSAGENVPLDDRLIEETFDGELRRYLEARSITATSLFSEVVEVIRSHGDIKVTMSMPSEASGRTSGLKPEGVIPFLDGVFTSPPDDISGIGKTFSEGRHQFPQETKILAQTNPEQIKGGEELKAKLEVCKDSGCDGFAFYNYGLLRMEQLEWIGEAREVWA